MPGILQSEFERLMKVAFKDLDPKSDQWRDLRWTFFGGATMMLTKISHMLSAEEVRHGDAELLISLDEEIEAVKNEITAACPTVPGRH